MSDVNPNVFFEGANDEGAEGLSESGDAAPSHCSMGLEEFWKFCVKICTFSCIFHIPNVEAILPCGPTDADRRRLSVFIGKQKVPR